MDKNNKLKELLKRLSSLESSLPISDTRDYLDSILKEQTDNFISNFKSNSTIKFLDTFNSKLDKFKKDFNLEPIISAIGKIQSDLSVSQETSTKDFEKISKAQESKYTELSNLVNTSKANLEKLNAKQIGDVLSKVDKIQTELTYQSTDSNQKGQSLNEVITQLEKRINDAFKGLETESSNRGEFSKTMDKRFSENTVTITNTVKAIEELRQDMLVRIQNKGGAPNQQINVNSSVMSKKYADVNFKAGTNITLTKADDDVNKRVNITITAAGGGSGNPGGSDTQVQFNDNGNFGGDPGFTFNKNTSVVAASILTVSTEKITVPDGPTRGLDITNNATVNGLRIVGASSIVASRSVGGQLLVSNGIINTGNAAVFYSNVASALGRIVHITADNVSFDREALYVESDSNSTTTLGIKGNNNTQGTVKIDHIDPGAGADANAAGLSIDLQGANTAAQGIFIDATTGGTTGPLINVRNNGSQKFMLSASGNSSVYGTLAIGQQGSVVGRLDMAGASTGFTRLQPASIAGNWTMTLPVGTGSAGQYLVTDGAGITQWASVTASGGSGITRSINTIVVNTTGGTTASTDYVYIATGLTFTLPTAVANTNLYTVKNVGGSSVFVATTAAQTIDGSANAPIYLDNQALGFISDNSNWRII